MTSKDDLPGPRSRDEGNGRATFLAATEFRLGMLWRRRQDLARALQIAIGRL